MKDLRGEEWIKEFAAFTEEGGHAPSLESNDKILKRVQADLNPPMKRVLGKLATIQALAGFATLLVCPQFGMSVLPGHGLMNLFMAFGDVGCMLGCGAIFLGSGTFAASLALTADEVRALRSHGLFKLALLSAFFAALFVCSGFASFSILLMYWILGGVAGAVTTLELGWRFRRSIQSGSRL